MRVLTKQELGIIDAFAKETGALAKDCIIEPDRIIMVIEAGKMGLAIGKEGKKVREFSKKIGKRIELVEEGKDPIDFIKKILHPYAILSADILEKNGKKMMVLTVRDDQKALVIGKDGKTIGKARLLLKRHYGVDWVKVK